MDLHHQSTGIGELIRKLESFGYEYFEVKSEDDLVANLQKQIERTNQIVFSEVDFAKVMGHISCLKSGSNRFDSDNIEIKRNCGKTLRIHLLDRSDMSKNKFQFAQKLYGENDKSDPYEVALYVNGLPFANVNLKKMDYLVGCNQKKLKAYSRVENM